MEQGLKDIRKKAREFEIKHGIYAPYPISCGTLIAILDELETAQNNINTTPKLLEALESVLKELDEADIPITLQEYKSFPRVKKLRAAIAKAKATA